MDVNGSLSERKESDDSKSSKLLMSVKKEPETKLFAAPRFYN